MQTLDYIVQRFNIDVEKRLPIEIHDFGRDNLASLFAELGFTSGAEIGVECGLYTEVLCKANPQATIYAIDAWQVYSGYRDHVSQGKLDVFYQDTLDRILPYDNCQLVRKFSMDAAKDFEDGSLDFVYVDANHELPHVINDIIQWSKKVRRGGIVSGHDYRLSKRFDTRNHVVNAVNAYTLSYRITPWFLLGTKDMIPEMIRDEARSWMWVKRHA